MTKALDMFVFHSRGLTNSIDYLRSRVKDYELMLANVKTMVRPGIVLRPIINIALLDNGPGYRVTVSVVGDRIELVVDEHYGTEPGNYSTEVYVIRDMRQAFAWFLAQYW
jgi:hypothetical protein